MDDRNAPEQEPITNPAGAPGAYPLQLVVLALIFALAIGVYAWITSDDGDSSGTAPQTSAIGQAKDTQ